MIRFFVVVLALFCCLPAQAGPVCEGGKCAVRATKQVVQAPVRTIRRIRSR